MGCGMAWCGKVMSTTRCLLLGLLLSAFAVHAAHAAEPDKASETAAQRGFRLLTTKPYLPPDFDQEVFESLWKRWPKELRDQAEKATPAERRKLTFSRYGMVENPEHPGTGTALGYVDDGKGGWVMNCLSCHSGKVAGKAILGVPNSLFALTTLTEDVRLTKLTMGKPLSHMDLGMVSIPLGGSRGTTNSVIFGVALAAHRDKDLNVHTVPRPSNLLHHDLEPPPYWNVRHKTHIYADGFVPRSPRPLMQFMMVPQNNAARLRSWESDFEDVQAWIESLEPPKYPFAIDQSLADTGRAVFVKNCAKCHGTPGVEGSYPNKLVAIDEIQTDPVRLNSLTPEYRRFLSESWFGDYGKRDYVLDPQGYVAPPLDGVWASAPYLHNGSVPTLWHILHPDERPVVWKRTEDGYDQARGGLEVTTLEAVPDKTSGAEKREYFDTHLPGKSAAGHRFPEALSEAEKQAVLEYLKSI